MLMFFRKNSKASRIDNTIRYKVSIYIIKASIYAENLSHYSEVNKIKRVYRGKE